MPKNACTWQSCTVAVLLSTVIVATGIGLLLRQEAQQQQQQQQQQSSSTNNAALVHVGLKASHEYQGFQPGGPRLAARTEVLQALEGVPTSSRVWAGSVGVVAECTGAGVVQPVASVKLKYHDHRTCKSTHANAGSPGTGLTLCGLPTSPRTEELANAHILIATWPPNSQFNYGPICRPSVQAARVRWLYEFHKFVATAREVQLAAAQGGRNGTIPHWQVVYSQTNASPFRWWYGSSLVWPLDGSGDPEHTARTRVTWVTVGLVPSNRFQDAAFVSGGPNQSPEAAFKASGLAEYGPKQYVIHPYAVKWEPRLHPAAWPEPSSRTTLALGVWSTSRAWTAHAKHATRYFDSHGPAATLRKFCGHHVIAGLLSGMLPDDADSRIMVPCLRTALQVQLERAGQAAAFLGVDARDSEHAFNVNDTLALMLRSTFCLQPAGDSWTRKSVFQSIMAGCIPVFFTPLAPFWLAFWDVLDWRRLAVYIPNGDVLRGDVEVMAVLGAISEQELEWRREYMAAIQPMLRSSMPGYGCVDGRVPAPQPHASTGKGGGRFEESCLREEVLWGLVRQQAQEKGWTV